MPWKVVKTTQCPAGKPWGVKNVKTGEVDGRCHPTKEKARAQQSAMYANDPDAAKQAKEDEKNKN